MKDIDLTYHSPKGPVSCDVLHFFNVTIEPLSSEPLTSPQFVFSHLVPDTKPLCPATRIPVQTCTSRAVKELKESTQGQEASLLCATLSYQLLQDIDPLFRITTPERRGSLCMSAELSSFFLFHTRLCPWISLFLTSFKSQISSPTFKRPNFLSLLPGAFKQCYLVTTSSSCPKAESLYHQHPKLAITGSTLKSIDTNLQS